MEAGKEQEFSVNQEAQAIIDLSIEREARCKKKVLLHMLKVLNQVCEKYAIRYFAIGKLLTEYLYQEDSYPKSRTYMIGMLREDYDIFFKEIVEPARNAGISVCPFYDRNGVLRKMHSSLRKREVFEDELGRLEIALEIRIEPYEFLPEDADLRENFYREVALFTREYRLASTTYMNRLKNGKKDLLGKCKNALYRRKEQAAFLMRHRKYRELIHRYHDIENPVCAGRVETLIYQMHPLDDIFPITKKPFMGTELMIPANTANFAVQLQEDENERIAGRRLEELKAFDAFCEKNGLTYFAVQCLASGCTHYHDYKPGTERASWALGMLRKDYDKAIGLLEKGADTQGLVLQLTVEEYPVIREKQTAVILEQYKKKNPGEHDYPIYILPFDAVPDDYDTRIAFLEEVTRDYKDLSTQIMVEKGLLAPIWAKDLDTWKQFECLDKKRQRYNKDGKTPKRIYTIVKNKPALYDYQDIFPTEKRAFHDFLLSCPNNPFAWHYKKDEDYTEYVAEKRTELLKTIDDICQEKNLVYFAVSKLLIGAVVYHDTIPNSDASEIEVGLLREDYEKFIAFIREHGKEYQVQLNEYYDGDGQKYPMRRRNISFSGGEYSKIRVGLLAFDKVPENYYLQQGFLEDLDEMNQNYLDLINYHSLNRNKLQNAEEVQEERLRYLQTADIRQEADKIEAFAQTFNQNENVHTYGRNAFARSKRIREEEIFPLRRVQFRDIMINCPGDYTPWQPVLNAELERQVAAIQKADLILIKEFDRVCQKLGVGYFVCGGTMLGYMRHGGFIPWDDDVDVAMLREDYDRFIREAGPLLGEGMFLQTRETDPNIPYLFSKIRLDNTEYITDYNEERDFHKGICLDIFPFDYVPNDLEERKEFVARVRSLAAEHHLIARKQYPKPQDGFTPASELEQRYYKEQEELRQYYWSKDLAKTQQAYLQEATKFNKDAKENGLRTVASFVPSYTYIDLEDLLPYQRGVFEGVEISVPKRPDIFLEKQYGDYMALPPKHQQVAHRLNRWSTWEESWDKPPKTQK